MMHLSGLSQRNKGPSFHILGFFRVFIGSLLCSQWWDVAEIQIYLSVYGCQCYLHE